MNPELFRANELESELEKAQSERDIEKMKELLPEYEKLVLKMSGKHFEQIENFNLPEQLERFKSFYSSHQIETPPDFEDQITEIWNRNQEEIQKAIEEKGFDQILFIPPYDTKDINDKTTADYTNSQGQKTETYQSSNFTSGGSFEGVHDTRTGTRIVLTHKDENLSNPEHTATKGKSIYDLCNATTDQEKAKIDELIQNKLPLPTSDTGLTLGEYLIADKILSEETGKHLDYSASATWLTATYSGSRVAYSCWTPDFSRVDVRAGGSGFRYSSLGARSSRVFN